jgi:hypothetical protein
VEIGEVYSIGLRAFDGSKDRLNSWLNSENAYSGINGPSISCIPTREET